MPDMDGNGQSFVTRVFDGFDFSLAHGDVLTGAFRDIHFTGVSPSLVGERQYIVCDLLQSLNGIRKGLRLFGVMIRVVHINWGGDGLSVH